MRIIGTLIGLIPFCVALNVAASTPAEEGDGDEAEALFKKGKTLFWENKYDEAAKAFRAANRLKYTWKLLYNIAQAEAAAKRYGLALETFERYLADGGDDIDQTRQAEVRKEISRLKSMVGTISVSGPDGARVLIDAEERGTLPLPGNIKISAGVVHRLVVRTDDAVLLERQVRLSSGESVAITAKSDDIAPPPTPTAQPTDAPSPAKKNPLLQPIGWGLLGVGAATAIAGIVTGGISASKEGELEKACSDKRCGSSEWETYNTANNLATATNILLPMGVALAAAGVVLVIVGRKREKRVPKSAVTVLPVPFGACIRRRF